MTPLAEPMEGEEAIERALLLRRRGFSYGLIAKVMATYHGEYYGPGRWRVECSRRGAVINPAMRRAPRSAKVA